MLLPRETSTALRVHHYDIFVHIWLHFSYLSLANVNTQEILLKGNFMSFRMIIYEVCHELIAIILFLGSLVASTSVRLLMFT